MRYLFVFLVCVCVSCSSRKDLESTIVYITNTGKKYHDNSCRYLGKSSIPISLNDAVNKGYKPCGECNPPIYSPAESEHAESRILDSATTDTITPNQPSDVVKKETTRCTGTTKRGSRCKHMTTNSSGKCFQHED